MVADLISSGGVPLIGGGLIGFATGYAMKKITKFVIIGLGLLALLLGYLEYQKWISINWTVVENQTSILMTHAAHKAYQLTQTTTTQNMGHEIPIGLGVLGFLPGLALGFARG